MKVVQQYAAVYPGVGWIFTFGERKNMALHRVAVVAKQPFVGAHPYQSLLVLHKTIYHRCIRSKVYIVEFAIAFLLPVRQ